MEILTARQKKAEELKRLTDLASQMAEMQLAELRAEIKVSSQISQPEPWAGDLIPVMLVLHPEGALWGSNIVHPALSFTVLNERVQKGEEPTNHCI